MTPGPRDHLIDDGSIPDRSITSGYHAMNVDMDDRHWREDNLAGWGSDPRPLHLRIAEVLVANLLVFALCALALIVPFALID